MAAEALEPRRAARQTLRQVPVFPLRDPFVGADELAALGIDIKLQHCARGGSKQMIEIGFLSLLKFIEFKGPGPDNPPYRSLAAHW
jgi:hypothetical protein